MPEFNSPPQPKHEATQSSYFILKYAHDTAESLIDAFASIRKARSAKGVTTDEEQDLLRAMVVFAGAGIDAMTKQLIRDALPVLVDTIPEAHARVQKLGARHLRRGGLIDQDDEPTGTVGAINPQRLAKVLFSETPRQGMVELLVEDLTAGSLQSAPELFRILEYVGVDKQALGMTERDLREVFECRNRLIHEMDIDFTQKNRNRFPRRREDMVRYANTLLAASNGILQDVDKQLTAASKKRQRSGRGKEA